MDRSDRSISPRFSSLTFSLSLELRFLVVTLYRCEGLPCASPPMLGGASSIDACVVASRRAVVVASPRARGWGWRWGRRRAAAVLGAPSERASRRVVSSRDDGRVRLVATSGPNENDQKATGSPSRRPRWSVLLRYI